MQFSSAAVAAFLLSAAGVVSAFTSSSSSSSIAFVSTSVASTSSPDNLFSFGFHTLSCACASCRSNSRTALFMSETPSTEAVAVIADVGASVEVPAEVEKLDGVLSEDEQHNTERPARKSLKKKGPQGKPLSEFTIGQSILGRIKSITTYGAFVDIGAETDGLLHISQLSVDFVSDVKDVLELNKEYDVRIMKIDEAKKQIALTLLSEQEEETAANNAASSRPSSKPREQRNNNSNAGRRQDDNSKLLAQLQEKGWDPAQFVEGTVVSVVDFGAFVNIDCTQLNAEVEGVLDGLVHISALSTSRVNSVSDFVKVDDKVKIRVKGFDKNKVSLSMVSVEDEQVKNEARGSSGGGGGGSSSMGIQGGEGAKDWKESLEKMKAESPAFVNKPVVFDRRK